MKTEIKQRWIQALKSGEYQQTKSCLRDSNGFCCLGVLTDLYAKEHNMQWQDDNSFEEQTAVLSSCVIEWAGLVYPNPDIFYEGEESSLAGVNDDEVPFSEIADLIAEQL